MLRGHFFRGYAWYFLKKYTSHSIVNFFLVESFYKNYSIAPTLLLFSSTAGISSESILLFWRVRKRVKTIPAPMVQIALRKNGEIPCSKRYPASGALMVIAIFTNPVRTPFVSPRLVILTLSSISFWKTGRKVDWKIAETRITARSTQKNVVRARTRYTPTSPNVVMSKIFWWEIYLSHHCFRRSRWFTIIMIPMPENTYPETVPFIWKLFCKTSVSVAWKAEKPRAMRNQAPYHVWSRLFLMARMIGVNGCQETFFVASICLLVSGRRK